MKLSLRNLVSIAVSLIATFGGVCGWVNHFLIVGIIFFVSSFLQINNKSNKGFTLFFLIFPFIVLYGGTVLYDRLFGVTTPQVYPIVLISIINLLIGFGFKLLYLKCSKKIVIAFASLYLIIFLIGGYIFMCNWLHCVWSKKYITQTEQLADIQIWDFSEKEVSFDENKVIVLEFWSIHCSAYFSKLYDLEKINNYYQNDAVVVYAVLIPWHDNYAENDDLEKRLQWIGEQNFTFNVVKMDTLNANKLGIGVPRILVFDKTKKVALDSSVQFIEKKIILNNIYTVIDKLLKE